MSKKICLLSLVSLALTFVPCSGTEEVDKYDNRRAHNEAFIDSLANVYATTSGRGSSERIEILIVPGNYIYYKEMEPMADHVVEAGNPKYTDCAEVYYRGTSILGEHFDGNFKGDNSVVNGKDPSEGDSPTTISQISGIITDWGEVLQRMEVGDRWKIYAPRDYAYGNSGTTGTLGCSALVPDITPFDFANTETELR